MEWLKIRRIALFSCIAAVVSILSAGISGIPFLRIMFRAAISALAFGVFITGLFWLMHRFLPELFTETSSPESGEEDQKGSRLDVVVEDDVSLPSTPSPQAMDGNSSQAATGSEPQDREPKGEDDLDAMEDKKEKPPVEDVSDFKDPGKLPDIESFSSDFVPSEESGGESGTSENSDLTPDTEERSSYTTIRSSNDEARDYFTENSTPEEMAKAVRTVVKRDE